MLGRVAMKAASAFTLQHELMCYLSPDLHVFLQLRCPPVHSRDGGSGGRKERDPGSGVIHQHCGGPGD